MEKRKRKLNFKLYSLLQWFSTFFDSRHPSFVVEQFGGTPSFNLPVDRPEIHKLAAPLMFFMAPKGFAAPLLRTTALLNT